MTADAHRWYPRHSKTHGLFRTVAVNRPARPSLRTTGEGRLPEDDQWAGRQPAPEERGQGGGQRPPYPIAAPRRRTTYGYRNTAGRRATNVPAALLDDGPRRRWNEFVMPAAVILAGVLIVVAFGFIINRAIHTGNSTATPEGVQPPALGQFSQAPVDQGAIPLPSASASPSPSRSASPSPSATPKPPTRTT